MLEAARFGLCVELLEGCGDTIKVEFRQCSTARYSQYDRNLTGTRPASGKPKHLSQLSHGQPSLCRNQNLLVHHEGSMPTVADPGGNLQSRKLVSL
jgi:hypothetical protein